jgi:hygromycin-B 7''-O-kinase
VELATDWDAFLDDRIAESDQHHHASGGWLHWIRQRLSGFSEPAFEPVLLSADITGDHVLLTRQDGCWCITGLIDFGDAMMGHPHYEFIAPFVCFTFGSPHLTWQLVASYGLAFTRDLADRLTTYCLLHRYARLDDFLECYHVEDGREFWRALWGDL